MIKHFKLKIIFIALFPLGLILSFLAEHFPDATERIYSRGIYRAFSSLLTYIFGLFRFSFAEISLILLIITAVVWIIIQIVKSIKKRDIWITVNIFVTALAVFALISFSFTFLWGLNYKRNTLYKSLELDTVRKPEVNDLIGLTESVVDNINRLVPQIRYRADGQSVYSGDFYKMAQKTNDGYTVLQKKFPVFTGAKTFPKKVMLSYPMCYTFIIGIYCPFTFEPNINYKYPDFALPMAMAHESAHLKGFAREDEAEFISYLSCINSPDIYFQYSGYLNAYMRLSGFLNGADSGAAGRLYSKLDDRAKNELNSFGVFCEQFETKVAQISEKVNDSYLKSQGEDKGTLSYDEMARLMLCYYIKTKG